MREIKFRVWDESKKVMLSQVGSWYFNDEYNEIAFHMNDVTFSDHKYLKLMQYTGLKDRNGKEIYEGDVIEEYDDGLYHWVVKWDNECACFYLHEQNIGEKFYLDDLVSVVDKGKVIGNIHEHPHLLKIEN